MFRRLWHRYNAALQSHPIMTNALSSMLVLGLGDSIAQTLEQKVHLKLSHMKHHTHKHTNAQPSSDHSSSPSSLSSSPLVSPPSPPPPSMPSPSSDNRQLSNAFSLYGVVLNDRRMIQMSIWGAFQAIPMYYWFRFLDKKFPALKLWPTVVTKVAINQLTYAPWINTVLFSYMIACDHGLSTSESRALVWQELGERLSADLWPTTKRSIVVWGSFHLFNFTFLPPHLRVLSSSILGVFWTAYLSLVGHDYGVEVDD